MSGGTPIRAAVCREFGAPLQLETLHLAPPGARDVQVRLHASSVCHSDITYMDGGWGGDLPTVFGHEGAGVVTAAGAESGVAVGTRVIVTLLYSCRRCELCQCGAPALCEQPPDANKRLRDAAGEVVAVGLKTGAFAEQVVVDASQVAPIGGDLPFEQACLLGCGVITGWGAVHNAAQLPAGAATAVLGCGGVGVNCLQAAALAGASPLVAIDLSEEKLRLTKQFGATHTLSARDEDLPAKVQAITGKSGFDFVFMAAGSARAIEQAAALLGKQGTLVLVGMPASGDFATMDMLTVANVSQHIIGTKMGGAVLGRDIPRLLRLHAQGRLNLDGLIAKRYALEEINDAIAAARSGDALRQVLVFPPE